MCFSHWCVLISAWSLETSAVTVIFHTGRMPVIARTQKIFPLFPLLKLAGWAYLKAWSLPQRRGHFSVSYSTPERRSLCARKNPLHPQSSFVNDW